VLQSCCTYLSGTAALLLMSSVNRRLVRKVKIPECEQAVVQALRSKGLTVQPWLPAHTAWVKQAALALGVAKTAELAQAAAEAGAAEAAAAPGLPTGEQQLVEVFSSGKRQHEQAADHAAALDAADVEVADTEAVRAAGECAGDDDLDLDKLLDAAVAQHGRQQQQQQHTQVAEQQQQQHEEGLEAQPEVEQGQEQQVPYASTTSPAACGSQAAITPPAIDDPAFEQQILTVLQGLYAL
jgi:hypothetical protein